MIKYIITIIILFYSREMAASENQDPHYLRVPRLDGKILSPSHHPFRTTYSMNVAFTISPTVIEDEEGGPAFVIRIIPFGQPIARRGWVWECIWKWCCCCCRRREVND